MTCPIRRSNCSRVVLTALVGVMVCTFCRAQQPGNSALFTQGKFTEIKLRGLTIRLGEPVEVTAQTGWHMSWPHYDLWSFVHLTPMMARFPDGELIVTYALDPDTQANPAFLSGFQISKDGGTHWGLRYSVIMQHIPMIFIPEPDNSLMALPSELMEQTPGDDRNLRGPLWRFEQGGKQMVMEPDGVHIVDWPWPIRVNPGPQPKPNWHCSLSFTGNAIKLGGELLATAYWQKKGEKLYQNGLLASKDGGHMWRYYAKIASPADVLPQSDWEQRSFEAANETSMIRLADGTLMAVFRVGSGRKWHLRQAFSSDEGRTWTKPDVLPAYSVEPKLLRIANGTIVLATGRPGIDLWFSSDPRGRSWQNIDIVKYHNRHVSEPNERISSFQIKPSPYLSENTRWQTSSYTGLVQVAPNRLLLVYDRDPERAPAGPDDLSRVFVLPIKVQRQ